MPRPIDHVPLISLALLAALFAQQPAFADGVTPSGTGDQEWQTIGLMRIRDLTPYGISGLDMLPAHAVVATPGTFALEMTYSYQNTWALSENVEDYLEQRGVEHGEIGPADIASIVALPGEAYLIDGEFGLLDLTVHYRPTRRAAFYATIPYFVLGGGFLDSTVESFHDTFGFSSAGRDFARRDKFLTVADLERATFALDEAPDDEFGDPVLGARYSVLTGPDRWNVVLEGAVKLGLGGSNSLLSNHTNDYGVQLSLQRIFERNAVYVSLAGVDYHAPERGITEDRWIPTVIGGWERRIAKRANLILQAAVSESKVQDTSLDELSDPKIQATAGVQCWLSRGYVVRFGVTENLANYNNTPDIGANLSIARIFFGSRPERAD